MVERILQESLAIVLVLVAIKAMIGFHFPWEKCDCCNRRWRDIKRK